MIERRSFKIIMIDYDFIFANPNNHNNPCSIFFASIARRYFKIIDYDFIRANLNNHNNLCSIPLLHHPPYT